MLGVDILVFFPYSALLGRTVDTCVASVYDALEIAQVQFMACFVMPVVGPTPVEIPQVQFLACFVIPVVGAVLGMLRHARCGADTRGDPTGAVLGMLRHARCGADTRGDPTGAVLGMLRRLRQRHVYGWFCLYAPTLVGKSAREVAHPGSIGICVHSCAGWTACIFLFVSADGRLYSGDGFSDGFSFCHGKQLFSCREADS